MTEATKQVGFESTTPNGTVVYFQAEPKRLYRVNGVEVPSVTTVLGVVDKSGPLIWWGQGVGIEATLELMRLGRIALSGNHPVVVDGLTATIADKENVTPLVTQYKLSTNHARDRAGDRGTSVHRALEAWGEDHSLLPDPRFYPEEEQGYVEGLRKFLGDLKLGKGKVEMEVMVGSVEHGYAGRYDLQAPIEECELVVNRTPVRGETREVFEKGCWLFDLKTSRSVYKTHEIQLAAYELASVECGYKPSIGQMVVRVDSEGYYVAKKSRAKPEHFLAVKSAYDALKSL